jgi:hypothetical protein
VRLDGTRGERDSGGSGDPGASSEAGAA